MHNLTRFSLFVILLISLPIQHSYSQTRVPLQSTGSGSLDRTGTLWSPYLEWSVENPTYSGNPFDLVATVTFTHAASGATHTTEMFYDGGDTWKWRFTGTQLGTWTFVSTSADPELDGLTGTVTIDPNPDPAVYGFVTEYESATHTKWARPKGNDGAIEAFVPQYVMYHPDPAVYHGDAAFIDSTFTLFFDGHGFNGFHVPSVAGQWFDMDADEKVLGTYSDPDPRTFEALELLITRVHAAGGVVHIWVWGDKQRTWSAADLPGGANGEVDRRLQRYIAARLGPLPGWTMGYGFDLFEWTDEAMLESWYTYMQDHLGWHHYLGGRASKNQLNQLYEGFDYSAYEWHKPTYDDYIDHLTTRPYKPAFSEDRFRIRNQGREKDYDMEETRRGLWHSTLAGGVANIWGNLIEEDGGTSDFSLPYPNPEWIQTYATFWEGRFLNDMEPCSELSDGYCLGDPARGSFVFYKESTNVVQGDLTGVAGDLRVVWVDTKAPYLELDGCVATAGPNTWELPYVSDWAIAVGTFGATGAAKAASVADCSQLPVELSAFEAVSDGRDVVLTWMTASETNNAGFELQQRLVGETAFQPVQFVDGAGTTTEPQTYEVRLPDLPPGTYRFRLKQVDFDGSFAFSQEVELVHAVILESEDGTPNHFDLELPFPNPFQDRTTLRLVVARPQGVEVALFDVTGRRIRTLLEQTVVPNTEHDILIEADNLPAGTYFVRVRGERFLRTVPVVLVR